MIDARKFNSAGDAAFTEWIAEGNVEKRPSLLLTDNALTDVIPGLQLDDTKLFKSRYDFGVYLASTITGIDFDTLMSPQYDGFWSWINALYFDQLTKGLSEPNNPHHYVCTRAGIKGSTLHRCAARTAFELVSVHGVSAEFAFAKTMNTHGQLLESLTATAAVVRRPVFFSLAAMLYWDSKKQKLRAGASNKVTKPEKRKAGDVKGRGGVRRLPSALRRLDMTFDVDDSVAKDLLAVLPSEYRTWMASASKRKRRRKKFERVRDPA